MALTIRTTVLTVHSEISLLLLCYATLLVMLRIGAMRLCYAMQLCCYAKLRGCAMLRSYVVLRSYAMLLVRRELLAQSCELLAANCSPRIAEPTRRTSHCTFAIAGSTSRSRKVKVGSEEHCARTRTGYVCSCSL